MIINVDSFKLVVLSNWISKILQASLQIYSIRLLTIILNLDEYAIYTLLMVLANWIILSDFGLGSSLQNFITECRVKNLSYNIYISNVASLIITIFVILLILFYPISLYVAPLYLYKFNTISTECKVLLLYITISILLVTALSSVVYRIFYALHKGYISNVMPAIAAIITFVCLYIVMLQKESLDGFELLYSVIASILPQAAIPLCCFIFFLKKNNIKLYFKMHILKKIFRRAANFWVFAFFGALTLQVDYFIASRFLDSNDVVLYNTLMKLYGFAFFMYYSVIFALWPIVSECINKNNFKQIGVFLVRYIPIGMILIVCFSILLYMTAPFILSILIKNTTLNVSILIIFLFCLYFLLRVWTDTFAMVLQSANILKPFWFMVPIQSLISIICQILFTVFFGIYGLLCGLIISFIATVVWYLPYKVKSQLNIKGYKNAKI